MHPIPQIPKPRRSPPTPNLLDPRVLIVARHRLARNADPVLRAAVLERDAHGPRVGLDVLEFAAVGVGQEEEVRSRALGDGHAAVDGAGAVAQGAEEADFQLVRDGVEVAQFGVEGDFVVPLLGDAGVGLGVDLLLGELFGHGEGVAVWNVWRVELVRSKLLLR